MTMNPFPDEWELLSLFESEPELWDPDIPWIHNIVIFETTRGLDQVRCEIDPSCGMLKLTWRHSGKEKLILDLHWVHGLQVVTGRGADYFIASFRDPFLCNLEFHLKPEVCMRWGTTNNCPP
jgi:hypothetical protein